MIGWLACPCCNYPQVVPSEAHCWTHECPPAECPGYHEGPMCQTGETFLEGETYGCDACGCEVGVALIDGPRGQTGGRTWVEDVAVARLVRDDPCPPRVRTE